MKTRERIVDAAQFCFKTYGVSASTMALIAEHAHCTRGAIYAHFKDQSEILKIILVRGRTSLPDRLSMLAKAENPTMKLLHATLLHAMREIESSTHMRAAMEILFYRWDYAHQDEVHLIAWRDEQRRLQQLLNKILLRTQQEGDFPGQPSASAKANLIGLSWLGALKFCLLLPISEQWRPHFAPALSLACGCDPMNSH